MITYIRGDITQVAADVIINAANTENLHGGGVDLAIARAAGRAYKDASNETNGVPLGKFLVSPSGNINAQVIIDIPTIDLSTGEIISLDALTEAWHKVLAYCQQQGYKTIATPLLGAGVVRYEQKVVSNLLAEVAEQLPELNVIIVTYIHE